jgi:hypothetical protein
VLARLDQELGPLLAAVDREGSVLRIGGRSSTTQQTAIDRVVEVVSSMGYIAEPISVKDRPNVDRWFGLEEVPKLSEEEARILSDRWTKALGEEGVFADAERIRAPLYEALVESMRQAASTGEIGPINIDTGSLRRTLDDSERQALKQWIESKVGRF